jgi:hypothetical protein
MLQALSYSWYLVLQVPGIAGIQGGQKILHPYCCSRHEPKKISWA